MRLASRLAQKYKRLAEWHSTCAVCERIHYNDPRCESTPYSSSTFQLIHAGEHTPIVIHKTQEHTMCACIYDSEIRM